jgi:predicted nucleic acid-binding protein
MAWVVDSCVLLDIALKDPEFGVPSALLLEKLRRDGLVACPISVIEVAPQFGGQLAGVREYLTLLGADPRVTWLEADTENASVGWVRYVSEKRARNAVKRPIADILIGGFACRFQGLVTRNPEHFLPFYPGLAVRQPQPAP